MGKVKKYTDLAGRTLGRLTILDVISIDEDNRLLWECRCSCGNTIVVEHKSLILQDKKTCGKCYLEERTLSLVGQRFGKLVVIEKGIGKYHGVWWKCQCDCGNSKTIYGESLKAGITKSCGCLSIEEKKKRSPRYALGNLSNNIPLNAYYRTYAYGAKERGLAFELSIQEFEYLTQQTCFYCPTLPTESKMTCKGHYIGNGVDRKNNQQGYTLENCVPCCSSCNRMKMTASLPEFLAKCKQITDKASITEHYTPTSLTLSITNLIPI